MTMMTLILSSLILVSTGLTGNYGMMATLLIGGVVCTALSMSGGFITDLKVGYWLGATPIRQQLSKFLGTIVAAVSVGMVIFLLNRVYGFAPATKGALAAPQANAMAALIQVLMDPNAQIPLLLLGVGALFILAVEMMQIPPLAFALGMYLPLELNAPLVIGGLIAHLVSRSTADKKLADCRYQRGILIASGFIAGGAIVGVISALLRNFVFSPEREHLLNWADRPIGEPLALVMFVILCLYLYVDSRRAQKEE
jgi:putative OPT family oligopeptide transporter